MPVISIDPLDRINLGGRYSIDTLYAYYRKENGYLSVYKRFLEDGNITSLILDEFSESGMPTFLADKIATNLGYHPSQIWPEWSSISNRQREEVLDELLDELTLEEVLPIYTVSDGKYRIGLEAMIHQIIAKNQDKILTPKRVFQAVQSLLSAHVPSYTFEAKEEVMEGKVRNILDKITMESYRLLSIMSSNSSILTQMPYLSEVVKEYKNNSANEDKVNSRPLPFLLLSIYKKKVFVPMPAFLRIVEANSDRINDIEGLVMSYFKDGLLSELSA
jgi:hypothetical protein